MLEELLAGEVLAFLDDPDQAPVADLHQVRLAALAPKVKPYRRPVHVDVAVAERGQPERAVLFAVLVIAHPDARFLEQAYNGVEYPAARPAVQPEVAVR